MSELVVVTGATGYVGRFLVQELSDRGFRVRAVVRSRARAEQPGTHGAPSLTGHVAQWREGDVTDPSFVAGLCEDADRVCSALGVTRQRASPWDVDYRANLRLLEDAERASVRSFLYIGVMHADAGRSLIMRSKAAFSHALSRSSVAHQIVNPSGYFSDMAEFAAMARSGFVLLPPEPTTRIAPLHGEDLARFCVDRIGDPDGTWDVGGPEVLTFAQIGRLAASSVDKRCRTVRIPTAPVAVGVWAARRIGGRAAVLAEFLSEGLSHDAIGERWGEHRLEDFFRELARAPRT
ncbi:MAG TPA: NAD(P)H-binding protein [Brevibacterium sp.]|nr:NAD(P)H-binding protein [Brevibacterium sp.]